MVDIYDVDGQHLGNATAWEVRILKQHLQLVVTWWRQHPEVADIFWLSLDAYSFWKQLLLFSTVLLLL